MQHDKPIPDGFEIIYVRHFWHRGARRRLYAYQFGLKAFRLVVRKRS
ncbi:MAG: hypothetical protein ABSA52_21835 [Candidatus Binatia bacterium]